MRLVKYFAVVLLALAMAGCGGGGGGGSSSNPFAGSYRTDFSRAAADTTMLVEVASSGKSTVVISDLSGVLFSGTGTTSNSGTLSATINGTGGSVNVAGDFAAGATKTLDAHLTGSIADDVSANQLDSSGSPLAGTYTGTYGGDDAGTFQITISPTGGVTGTVHTPGGDTGVHGSVNLTGSVSFDASGSAGTAAWSGSFFFVPNSPVVHGGGTWTDQGDSASGQWTVPASG